MLISMLHDALIMHWNLLTSRPSTATSPWHSDALSITVVSLKVYNTRYNCNALPCHNLMHY
jgi:hypothetical protein